MGPIGRRLRASPAVLVTLVLLAGCSSGVGSTPTSSPSASTGTSSAAPSSATTTPQATDAGVPSTQLTAFPSDELAYDPVPRTITGIVARGGGCTVLVAGQVRWVLTGDLAGSLGAGSRFTVAGYVTRGSPPCAGETGPLLQVTSATPA